MRTAAEPRASTDGSGRAQANLPAFAIAVLVVTSTATLALLVVDGAFVAADRRPLEEARATGLAASMVAADSPTTERTNVLNATRTSMLDANLEAWFPVSSGMDVRITLGEAVLVERGTPTGGTTIRRLVLVAEADRRVIEPAFTSSDTAVTLPRRATAVTLDISPPARSTVSTVRANGRVVLHDPGGLAGTYRVDLSRFETTTLQFNSTGPLDRGSVRVVYRPETTRKAVLGVTVDG